MWNWNSRRGGFKYVIIAFYTSSIGPNQEFIEKIEMLCTYYKGRTSFLEMMNMPLSYINALYKIAVDRQADDEQRKLKEAEVLQDEVEDAIT